MDDWWVKFAVRYWVDDKIAALPDADTELMFVRGVCSDHAKRTGGFIPESALPELARRRRYATCVDSLVANGLWLRVDGGYRITRWADWQDALDVLERRRAADRERKRAKRAAEREARASQTPSVRGQSGDGSADFRATEGEGDRDLGVKGVARVPGGDQLGEPPPRFCERHPTGTDDPCWPCGEARQAHKAWTAAQSQRVRGQPSCRVHRGQPANNCGLCRAEELSPP